MLTSVKTVQPTDEESHSSSMERTLSVTWPSAWTAVWHQWVHGFELQPGRTIKSPLTQTKSSFIVSSASSNNAWYLTANLSGFQHWNSQTLYDGLKWRELVWKGRRHCIRVSQQPHAAKAHSEVTPATKNLFNRDRAGNKADTWEKAGVRRFGRETVRCVT